MRHRCATLLAFALLPLAAPSTAGAHGGFWRAHDVLIAPDDEDRIVLRSDVWGLAVTADGGASWSWLCAEPLGRETTTPRRVGAVALAGGKVAVASLGDGLRVMDGDPCEWSTRDAFADTLVRDVAVGSADGTRVLALATRSDGSGTTETVLYESTDTATSFAPHGATLPAGVVGQSLSAAPSDGDRIYAAAASGETLQVAASSDGGDSWTLHTHVVALGVDQWEARVLAVHPTDPDVLLVVADAFEPRGGQVSPDTVFLSSDGGATLQQIFAGQSDVPAAAFSPDGSELLLGAIADGLLGAETSALLSDGSAALELRHGSAIYGLTWTRSALWAGTEEFAEGGTGFSVGRSDDGGRSFERVMSVCDVVQAQCGEGTTGALVCPARWSDMGLAGGGFYEDFLDNERCAGEPTTMQGDAGVMTPDAGATPTRGGDDGDDTGAPPDTDTDTDAGAAGNGDSDGSGDDDAGCSCSAPGGSAPLRNALPISIVGMVLWWRRRRAAARCDAIAAPPC